MAVTCSSSALGASFAPVGARVQATEFTMLCTHPGNRATGGGLRQEQRMGMTKRVMEQQDAQGWSFSDQYVCTACVSDYALAAAIAADKEATEVCDFCGTSPAAPLGSLLTVFVMGLKNEYGTADDECVYWDGREGGYQWGETWDTWDLIHYEHGDALIGDGLADAVSRSVTDTTWVKKNFAWRPRDKVLSDAWDQFCETVKYHTRYVLWLRENVDLDEAQRTGEVPPALVLQEVGNLLVRLGVCVDILPAGFELWRARTHMEGQLLTSAKDLGTAERRYSKQANRMSPAGIPMFYGATEPATAIQEVAVRSEDNLVTAGRFEMSRPCTVVDFTRLPATPSIFDPEWGSAWRYLRFLNSFIMALSQPARETYEQIDYVPTQIVTEYLLRIFLDGEGVDGLLYASALTGEVCAVLDVPYDRCVKQTPGWEDGDELRLGLSRGSQFTRALTVNERSA